MPEEFTIRSTASLRSDIVEPFVLSQGQRTRKILKGAVIDNPNNPEANLKVSLMHQKKHNRTDEWQDAESFNLAGVPSGQEVRFNLGTEETLALFNALVRFRTIASEGVTYGESRLAVIDTDEVLVLQGRERQITQQLMSETGEDFWNILEELNPGVLERVAFIREHQRKIVALQEFESRMSDNTWNEGQWQSFFSENLWIFGHGLDYQCMTPITEQAIYGGQNVRNQGMQRGDYLMATGGNARFTVLVEIKRPDTPLLSASQYRNGAFAPSAELSGGVAQLQTNCRTWNVQSTSPENADLLESENIFTCEPCGILIVGNTRDLQNNRSKRNSFQLYRKNLQNPEILTFDELYSRADFIVNHPNGQLQNVPVEPREE